MFKKFRFYLSIIFLIVIGGYFILYQKDTTQYGSKKLVTILQIAEHPALDVTRKGIEDGLKNCCYTEHETAHGSAILALQIAQKFRQQKPKVVVAIGTVAAQAFLQKSDMNVVFSSVTDPVAAGLLKDINKPDMNFTGVSNMVQLSPQFELFKKMLPNLKTIGIIYNPGEANSVKLIEKGKEVAADQNIEIKEVVANSSGDVIVAAQKIVQEVDAIFITNDSTALSALSGIVRVANAANIPVFCSDVDTINLGVIAAFGPDQYQIGQRTAKIVEQIVQGKTIANIPVQWPDKAQLKINLKAARRLGIIIDNDLIKSANEVVE